MLFPFYWDNETSYTINDADYDCNKIIVATCDNSHRYATLCELVENCPSVRQLTRPCIVNWLNNLDVLWQKSWLDPKKRFLKVWVDWCLEIADPCICNEDKYVIATEGDTDPGPLNTKVKWSCSFDWLYCIDIEEAGPQTLVWRPSGPNWPFINPDLPNCEEAETAYVKMRKVGSEWKVEYECEEEEKVQFAYCDYTSWLAADSCYLRSIRYFATHAWSVQPVYDWSKSSGISYFKWWDWEINATDAFAAPDSYWFIKITKPGIYIVAWSCYVRMHNTCNAIRAGIYVNKWEWFHELNDIKYDSWEVYTPWEVGYDPICYNPMHPFTRDPQRWSHNRTQWSKSLDFTWLPFSRTYIINVENPIELALAVKPDMQYLDAKVYNDRAERYYIRLEWEWGAAYGARTSVEIVKVSENVPYNKTKVIKP